MLSVDIFLLASSVSTGMDPQRGEEVFGEKERTL